jgi:excinuclease ABC subunit C
MFKNNKGRILYVGKAKRLRDRVRSHFTGSHDTRHEALVSEVDSADFIVTGCEMDALVLEANLVRDRQPYYNVNLKDDKRFPYLKVTLQEEYPRLLLTRNAERDGSRYFGPYTDVKSLRGTMKLLRTAFPLRTCGNLKARQRLKKDCLSLHIDRCCGPCLFRVTAEEYRHYVDELLDFLSGKSAAVLERIERSMERASAKKEYEKCALLRDRIAAVKRVPAGKRVVDLGDPEMDVLGMSLDKDTACVAVLKVRDGKVIDQVRRFLDCGGATSRDEILTSFIEQYYLAGPAVPARLATPGKLERTELLQSWLEDMRGAKVSLKAPQRGPARKLVEMAGRNAELALAARALKEPEDTHAALEDLQEALRLQSLPYVIDCYDISNTAGTNAVGARVVFVGGVPSKEYYRRYKIKRRHEPNDTAMIGEVVERSLGRRVRQGEEPPDLVLVDGGKGQVSAAVEAAARVGLEAVPVAGLAKAEELVYLPGRRQPVSLSRRSASLRLLQRLRDEAHRFGLTFHRARRAGAQLGTLLDGVAGVGPQRRRLLLRKFGSAEGVLDAPDGDIASLPGLGPVTARKIKEALRARIGGGRRA